MDGKPINYGRRSEIYQHEKGKILKLYDKDFPVEKIEREFRNSLMVWESRSVKTPQPYRMVEVEGRSGIVYEKIEGISFMDYFQRYPYRYFGLGKVIGAKHRELHQVKINALLTQQEMFTPLIQNSVRISNELKKALLDTLNSPYEPVLCHGDFHHGNLIMTADQQVYTIDWMDAFSGAFQLDVALTAVNAAVSTAPYHVRWLNRNLYELLKKLMPLDKRYLRLYGATDLDKYLFLAAGIHLAQFEGTDYSAHLRYLNTIYSLL